ncbi:MAG: MgtC/SapB family protein [Treponema sp.]|nr:MgtC/SapB family protein [Treponema sp.]MBQ5383464.1 MgtC/SapB family protein [Treponema sp.]
MVCGFVLGIERKSRNQAVGIRTLVLICVSSTLLSILSIYVPLISERSADSARIIAGVVSGIGFLGGGAIMRQGMNIKGLTSAAIIWTAAAVGLSLGAGLYVQSAIVLLVVELILILIEKLERKLFPAIKKKAMHLTFVESPVDQEKISEAIERDGIKICDLNITRNLESGISVLHYSINLSDPKDFEPLIQEILKIGRLTEFSITD